MINLANISAQLRVADYLFIFLFLMMLANAFRIGKKRLLFNLIFFVIVAVIASQLTTMMANTWVAQIQYHPLLSWQNFIFLSLIIALFVLRILAQQVIIKMNQIQNPCWFNGITFWLLALLIINLILLTTPAIVLVQNVFNSGKNNLYLVLLVATLLLLVLVVKKFNINLYGSQKCWLHKFYTPILSGFHALYVFFSQRPILSLTDALLIIMVVILYFVVLLAVYFGIMLEVGVESLFFSVLTNLGAYFVIGSYF